MGDIKFQYIILALLIFGALILVHECGHYLTARLFGISIREFAIGMGPKILHRSSKKTGIVYSIRLLPIGGFVSMVGEDEESEDKNAFNKKPVWQRIIVTVAGATMNILLGVLVMSILVAFQAQLPSTTISRFYTEDAVSFKSGLQPGDTIIKIDDASVHIANDMVYEIMRKGIEPLDVTVIRNGQTILIKDVVFPTVLENKTLFGNIDFYVAPENKTPANVLKHAVFRSVSTINMIWESLYDLITGRYGVESVSGPVGVTEALGEAAQESVSNLIYMSVVISMNLGVMNLLPLPALDGGRLFFLLLEFIRKKPLKPEIEGYIHFVGLVFLMILMIAITFKDVVNLF